MAGILSFNIAAKTKVLFDNSRLKDKHKFHNHSIAHLPDIVQRYFKYALKEDHPYLNFLRLKFDGKFKIEKDKNWTDISGEQYFRADPPGFLWVGKTKLFEAFDSYIDSKGQLAVYLFGFIRIVKKEGKTIDQAELLRWLGESVWMPTNLLPNKYLSWSPIDKLSARLTMQHDKLQVSYTVKFNEKAQITKFETERYLGNNLEKWIGEVDDYIELNGVKIPVNIRASWILDGKKYTYADFHVNQFEFDRPSRY